jgi:hypothetical protein
MEQERTRMMVSGESSYAATIVEPASSLTKPVWPSVGIVLMCFMMVGAICGYVIHTLKETKYKISRMVFRSSAQSWGTLFDQTIKSNANDVTLSQDESRLQSIADRKRSSMK